MLKYRGTPITRRIEEILLILMIFLNVLSIFNLVSGDFDFAKNIISWTLLGYLVYKVSLTRIIFNSKNTDIDMLLVISFFLLIFKNIIAYISINSASFHFFYDFASAIVDNSAIIEFYTFSSGSIMLLFISLYSALRINIRKPSLMDVVRENGPRPQSLLKILRRLSIIFLAFLGFFIIVFNLFMEWIVMAIHSQLIIAALLFYVFVVIRHYRNYDVESVIFKIGKFGEGFYMKFVSLFHYRKSIHLGFSGILVLHLLTDVGIFILPNIFVPHDSLYFRHLGIEHKNIISLFIGQSYNLALIEKASLLLVYAFNLLAMIWLLSFPALLWYLMFKNKKIRISPAILSFFFASLLIFILAPVFTIKTLSESEIVGVSILAGEPVNKFFPSFFSLILMCLAFLIVFNFSTRIYPNGTKFSILAASIAFFGAYLLLFFISLFNYYSDSIKAFISSEKYLLSFYFLILLLINMLFYAGGFILFIINLANANIQERIEVL